jgi:hypothetical protein
MSARGSAKKRSAAKDGQASHAYYVYCVGEREPLSTLMSDALPAPIEEDARLEAVSNGELAAVVSLVPLSDYGEDALPERISEPAWTALRAMRHERVLEHFARRTSVVPLRFGTIYLQRAGVEKMLDERGEELRSIIERLRGQEEWSLNIYSDRAKLMKAITQLSARLRELDQRASAASPGQAYLMRKKIEAMRADEARVEIRKRVEEIEQSLKSLTTGAVALRVLKDEADEHGEIVGKLAFLVERERFSEFRAEAERLAQEFGDAGFQLQLTGPWPCYSFAVAS